jgi:uncharacterized membrane protein YoaK (UPF0700 family)
MPESLRDQIFDASLLSFIAGFVDTCVFVGLFGLFTAHVTGNLALIGAQLVHRDGDVLAKLLSLPVFVLAVALTVHLGRALRRAGHGRVAPMLCIEAVLLTVTIAVSTLFGTSAHADDPFPVAAGLIAAAAMGLQNAMMRIELAALPSTTVMTVNVTQVVIDAVVLAARRDVSSVDTRERDEAAKRFRRMWPPLTTFVLGAACGATGYVLLRMWSLALPAVLCVLLAARFARR